MAASREKRSNAGTRMSKLLDEEEEDEFYKNTYGGFEDAENDQEYKSEDSGDDDVDSDFSIDENDEVISDHEDDKPKRAKRLVTRAYKEPKKVAKKETADVTDKPFPFNIPEDQAGPSNSTPVKKPVVKKQLSAPSKSERKSCRKSTAAKSAELRKRVKQRDEEYQRRRKKMKLKEKKEEPMTQEELLEEAKATERENIASLEQFQLMELEKKKIRPVKKTFKGPMIRYHSFAAPLIEELPSSENQTIDVDDTMVSVDEPKEPEMTSNDKKCERTLITFPDEATLKSLFPQEKRPLRQPRLCPFSRTLARYFDPVVRLPYSNVVSFRILRSTYESKLESMGDRADPEVASWIAWRKKQQELRTLVAKKLQQIVTNIRPQPQTDQTPGPSSSANTPTIIRTAGQTILSGAPTRPTILIPKQQKKLSGPEMSYPDGRSNEYWPYCGGDTPPPAPSQSYLVQTTQRVEYFPSNSRSEQNRFTEVHHYTTVSTSYGAYPGAPPNFSVPPPGYPAINQAPPSMSSTGVKRKSDLEVDGYKVSAERAEKIMKMLLKPDPDKSPPRRSSYSRERSSHEYKRRRSRSPRSNRGRSPQPRRRSPDNRSSSRRRSPDRRTPSSSSSSRSRYSRRVTPERDRRSSSNRPKERPVGRVHPYGSQSVPANKQDQNRNKKETDVPKEAGEERNGENGSKGAEKYLYVSSTPFEQYYKYIRGVFQPTRRQLDLCKQFEEELIQRGKKTRASKPAYPPLQRKQKLHIHKCCQEDDCDSSESEDDDDDGSSEDEGECSLRELEHKKKHPDRLHAELWFNDAGEMNDGPLCRCSMRSRRSGIRHGIYAGEEPLPACNPDSNNAERLYHYRITISPPTNFLTKLPTVISHDGHEYLFEGFSLLSHYPVGNLPVCKVIRFNFEYTIEYIEEDMPYNFTMRELDLFYQYLFVEMLELVDFNMKAHNDPDGCPRFHFFPRFVRELPENGISLLCMSEVMKYLLDKNRPLVNEEDLLEYLNKSQTEWLNVADEVKGMIVTNPGLKPSSIRVDQLDREKIKKDFLTYPEIVHFGIRPPQLSYAGNAEYNREWREYVKLRHLIANSPKPSSEEKYNLKVKEDRLQEMRMQNKMKRDVTVAVSAEGFYRTGIMADMVQHAMVLPVLVCHLRFHKSVDQLEKIINYQFRNRYLLQLALTHPSYRENFGTNPDHARNSLTNCGIRQPEYGDRRIHYQNTRKRGIKTLISIMSLPGRKAETESNITHNERLEFLGDAVVEFVSSIHLFFMFPDLEEGGLATYRAAIVQNQHLALLAKTLHLEEYMLYAHGSDLCHDLELRHAMANCFEALMGALYLDGGIDIADRVFSETFFKGDGVLANVWIRYPKHPLQQEEPSGDRHWVPKHLTLQKLVKFEEDHIGIPFNHIRLLARAFTDRSIGYNNITLGSNQRLEFLGDTVLQLIASNYLYKHFPNHHEGHLSLLRSSLVNNRTQARVCDDIGLTEFAIYSNPKSELKTKDRADLLEALLGALYVDKNLEYCTTFCNVCFFPRLRQFILNQDWNDPKSKLQQCCLTLRTMDGKEPDIPYYKVVQCIGPTNTRVYTVAVYFRDERLATAEGHSIQQAEMNAAKKALLKYESIFPQISHQKMVLQRTMTKKKPRQYRAKDEAEQSDKNVKDNDAATGGKKKNAKKKKTKADIVEETSATAVPCPTLSSLLMTKSVKEEKPVLNTDIDFSLSSSDNDVDTQQKLEKVFTLSEGECSSSE
ncbi:Hypothetical predicted protein [Cloeon dipterum]|uniref:Ribonuclease 3 n=1 Tax=Cloeon dipterum TaxID=197152 RepID=A0A8S1CZH8_9INSE|nr:Hypothetical predicted protein [Cloeon dipterum]